MSIFDVLKLIGGLSLFLFGMDLMGQALERRAGGRLKSLLGRLTTGKLAGLLTGLCVTGIIQSSSATTVMVVGFVNSGLMTLKQAINVIMGANIGTTVTAWILSLGGIDGSNFFVQLLKPSSFTPVLAMIGLIFCMVRPTDKRRDTGTILLGFATLMYGMETMSAAVAGLSQVPAFTQAFTLFTNPILGVLAGALLTAIIQSSSASVGILQALAVTGSVTYAAAIPIIMGQNIGTCITAMLSSIGANKNARRAALVHLCFNIIGTVSLLIVFCVVKAVFTIPLLGQTIDQMGIAVVHSAFNILCTAMLFPASSLLEKLVCRLVPDGPEQEKVVELDPRLMATPPLALERCHDLTVEMNTMAVSGLMNATAALKEYDPKLAQSVRDAESRTDHLEDEIGTYLVKLSAEPLASAEDTNEAAKLLRIIGDLERIGDHALNILGSAEEMRDKHLTFTHGAIAELDRLGAAVGEILGLTAMAFQRNDLEAAAMVEPLEQVIDELTQQIRTRHIARLQRAECSIETGFILSDVLTNLERTADHCSNIAGCLIDMAHSQLNLHESLQAVKHDNADFDALFKLYHEKYALGQ